MCVHLLFSFGSHTQEGTCWGDSHAQTRAAPVARPHEQKRIAWDVALANAVHDSGYELDPKLNLMPIPGMLHRPHLLFDGTARGWPRFACGRARVLRRARHSTPRRTHHAKSSSWFFFPEAVYPSEQLYRNLAGSPNFSSHSCSTISQGLDSRNQCFPWNQQNQPRKQGKYEEVSLPPSSIALGFVALS